MTTGRSVIMTSYWIILPPLFKLSLPNVCLFFQLLLLNFYVNITFSSPKLSHQLASVGLWSQIFVLWLLPLYSIQHPISSFLDTFFSPSAILIKCHPSQEVYTDFIWKKNESFFFSASQRALFLMQPDTLLALDLFPYLLIICMTVLYHSIMLVIKVLNWLACIFTWVCIWI